MVYNNDDIKQSFKFHFLVDALQGDALDIIKNIKIIGENYVTAWTAVTTFHENKRHLVGQAVGNFYSLPPMKSESHNKLRSL